jgi:hypothetical protein
VKSSAFDELLLGYFTKSYRNIISQLRQDKITKLHSERKQQNFQHKQEKKTRQEEEYTKK